MAPACPRFGNGNGWVAAQAPLRHLVSQMGYSAYAPFPTMAFVEVLRFELIVERGLCETATLRRAAARGESWNGVINRHQYHGLDCQAPDRWPCDPMSAADTVLTTAVTQNLLNPGRNHLSRAAEYDAVGAAPPEIRPLHPTEPRARTIRSDPRLPARVVLCAARARQPGRAGDPGREPA